MRRVARSPPSCPNLFHAQPFIEHKSLQVRPVAPSPEDILDDEPRPTEALYFSLCMYICNRP
jgi:hypothetical protein